MTSPSSPPDFTPWDVPVDVDDEVYAGGTGYESPLIARMSQQRLTVALLQEQIPLVRAGEEAQQRLDKSGSRMKTATRAQLHQQVREGNSAKEKLFAAALPLIRTIAGREWRRRRQWGSQVSLDDLTQEAIVGFLKGISGFNVDAIGRSGTNYLGQWMLVEARRAAESLDHDLQVGHDAGERFRRIRALRSRLIDELGREPTDQEIADASRNLAYVTRPGLVGKAPKAGEKRKPGRGVTEQQVAEERKFRSRLGASNRFGEEDDSENQQVVDDSRARTLTVHEPATPEEIVVEESRSSALSVLMRGAMEAMRLPDAQREMIARRYGLPPFTEETSAREISRLLGVQRDKVSRIISAFNEEMMRPGGVLHAQLRHLDRDDIVALDIEWLVDSLGEWPIVEESSLAALPAILVDPLELPTQRGTTQSPNVKVGQPRGVVGWFMCEFHHREFSAVFPARRNVPKTRPCPACSKTAPRVRVTDLGAEDA